MGDRIATISASRVSARPPAPRPDAKSVSKKQHVIEGKEVTQILHGGGAIAHGQKILG